MAIVEMFLMKVGKVMVDLQKLWISFSVVLFSGEMNPLDPISKGFTYTLWVSMSDTKWAYFSECALRGCLVPVGRSTRRYTSRHR